MFGQIGVSGYLHRGNEGAEGRAATRSEEHQMTTAGGEGSGGYEVVTRGREQVKTTVLQTVAILHDTADGSLTTLLGTAEGLVLEGRYTASLIARTGILTDGLAMRQEILLEVIDHRYRLVEEFFGAAAVHQDGLSTKHLGHFGEHAGTALSHKPVAELTHKRIGGNA